VIDGEIICLEKRGNGIERWHLQDGRWEFAELLDNHYVSGSAGSTFESDLPPVVNASVSIVCAPKIVAHGHVV
jgi:hypothetical protein